MRVKTSEDFRIAYKRLKKRHEALCGIFSSDASQEELIEDYLKDKYQL